MPGSVSGSAGEPRRKSSDLKAQPRPRFNLSVDLDVPSVLERIRSGLERNTNLSGMVLDTGRIELIFSEEKVRFWFPQLIIDVEAEGDGSILRARFGPHPHVWTLYVMLYSTSLAILIGCIMLGISQWMVGSQPWGLYLTPASFILSGLVYGASYVGQGLGSLQMLELRSFVERALWPPGVS